MSAIWTEFKAHSHEFSVALALFLIFETGQVIIWKLAFATDPTNYWQWFILLFGMTGMNVAGLAAIRSTSSGYAAAKFGATPSPVTVQGDANVTATHPVQAAPTNGPTTQINVEPQGQAPAPIQRVPLGQGTSQ